MSLNQDLVALLYTAGDQGITLVDLAATLQTDQAAIRQHLEDLMQQMTQDNQEALVIQQYGDIYKLLTKPQYYTLIKNYWQLQQTTTLSQAALEILAIIAYRQPITRIEIDEIRGVKNSSSTLQTLVIRQLVQNVGHKNAPGRPRLYGTTPEFLDYFGLKNLAQLPELSEFQKEKFPDQENFHLFNQSTSQTED